MNIKYQMDVNDLIFYVNVFGKFFIVKKPPNETIKKKQIKV